MRPQVFTLVVAFVVAPAAAAVLDSASILIDARNTDDLVNQKTGASWVITGSVTTRTVFQGVLSWDLSLGHTAVTQERITTPSQYSQAYWINLRTLATSTSISLFRHQQDTCLTLVQDEATDSWRMGFWSLRSGGGNQFEYSGTNVPHSEWLFIGVVGVQDADHTHHGTSTFYVGNQTAPPVAVGTVPRVCSGDTTWMIGFAQQGPGHLAAAVRAAPSATPRTTRATRAPPSLPAPRPRAPLPVHSSGFSQLAAPLTRPHAAPLADRSMSGRTT